MEIETSPMQFILLFTIHGGCGEPSHVEISPDMDSPWSLGYDLPHLPRFHEWNTTKYPSDETHQYQHMAETRMTVSLGWNMCNWMFQHTMFISQLQSIYWFPSGWLVWLPTRRSPRNPTFSTFFPSWSHHFPLKARRRKAEAMAGGRRRGGRRSSHIAWYLALRNRWKSGFEKCLENGKQRLSYDEKVVGWLDAETLVKTQQPKCENLGGRVSRCGRHHIRSPHWVGSLTFSESRSSCNYVVFWSFWSFPVFQSFRPCSRCRGDKEGGREVGDLQMETYWISV